MTTCPAEQLFNFLRRIHDKAVDCASDLTFDKRFLPQLYVIALYGSIIELTASCIILLERSVTTGVPMLLRGILEAYVDFTNLCNDPAYIRSMQANHLKEWIRVFEEAEGGQNPYLGKILRMQNFDETLKNWEAEKSQLKKEGFKPMCNFHRFKRAGMEKEYRSIYNFLCCGSHNDIRALVARHIDIKDDDFAVIFYKGEPLSENLAAIDSICGILVGATCRIHRLLNSTAVSEVEKLDAELTTVRSCCQEA